MEQNSKKKKKKVNQQLEKREKEKKMNRKNKQIELIGEWKDKKKRHQQPYQIAKTGEY